MDRAKLIVCQHPLNGLRDLRHRYRMGEEQTDPGSVVRVSGARYDQDPDPRHAHTGRASQGNAVRLARTEVHTSNQ
jgi:hypothetical protein